jgi:hypothetical protein
MSCQNVVYPAELQEEWGIQTKSGNIDKECHLGVAVDENQRENCDQGCDQEEREEEACEERYALRSDAGILCEAYDERDWKRAKSKRSSELAFAAPGLYPPPGTSPTQLNYWFRGLNATMPVSVLEQAPAGSTRTTASSSAQNARIPVWLMVIGEAWMV